MKTYPYIFFLLLMANLLKGQTAGWLNQLGEMGGESCTHLAATANGIAAGGIFQQSLAAGGQNYSSEGGFDIFIVWYHASGAVQQAMTIGNASNNELKGLQTDSLGNLYIIGTFSGTLQLGNATLQSNNLSHFIAKYNANAQVVWADELKGTGANKLEAVHWDESQQRLLLSGTFKDSLQFQQSSIYQQEGQNFFAMSLDAQGLVEWMISGLDAEFAIAKGILAGINGTVWVAVEFKGVFVMPQDTHYHNFLYSDIMLIQLDSQGNCLKWKHLGGVYEDQPELLLADPDGRHFWLLGQFVGVLKTDSIQLLTAFRYLDAFWMKFNDAGEAVMAGKSYTNANTFVRDATFQGSQLIVGGYFLDSLNGNQLHYSNGNYDFFQMAIDTSNARILSSETAGAAGNDLLEALQGSPSGLYLAGSFQQSLNFQQSQLAASGFSDAWIARQNYLTATEVIPDIPNFIKVELIPNPAKDSVTIKVADATQLKWILYALNGQQVATGKDRIINIENLPKGIYSLQVRTKHGEGVAKLVKK